MPSYGHLAPRSQTAHGPRDAGDGPPRGAPRHPDRGSGARIGVVFWCVWGSVGFVAAIAALVTASDWPARIAVIVMMACAGVLGWLAAQDQRWRR